MTAAVTAVLSGPTLRRALAAAAAATLAVTGLAACQSKVGSAAVVGDTHIGESDVASYVSPSGVSKAVVAQAQQNGGQVSSPRVQSLDELVKKALFESALQKSGGVPGEQQLADLHDEAAQRLLGATNTAGLESQLRANVAKYGLKPSFVPLFVRNIELEDALINRTHSQNLTELIGKIDTLGSPVTISPRYGTWNARTLSVTETPSAGAPSFVELAPSAGANG